MTKIFSLAILAVLLAGCVTTGTVAPYCEADKPVSFSATLDTPETIRAAQQHNAVYTSLCGNVRDAANGGAF